MEMLLKIDYISVKITFATLSEFNSPGLNKLIQGVEETDRIDVRTAGCNWWKIGKSKHSSHIQKEDLELLGNYRLLSLMPILTRDDQVVALEYLGKKIYLYLLFIAKWLNNNNLVETYSWKCSKKWTG